MSPLAGVEFREMTCGVLRRSTELASIHLTSCRTGNCRIVNYDKVTFRYTIRDHVDLPVNHLPVLSSLSRACSSRNWQS